MDTRNLLSDNSIDTAHANGPDTVIDASGLSKTFPGPPEVTALRAAHLRVSIGETVALTGPSGAGKSTLLNLLGLLDVPTSGRYDLDGQDTATYSERQRTRTRAELIGFVFQAAHLVQHLSCVDNVALPLAHLGVGRKERRERAMEALARVGLEHRRNATSNTLSGGERQRVAIARAVVAKPRLLLCDEPTGALDSENTDIVLDVIGELAEDRAVVIVTHDLDVAARAARRVEVRDGATSEID